MELCTAHSMLNTNLHNPRPLLFPNPNHLLHSKPSLRPPSLAPLTGALLPSRLIFVSKSFPRETSEEVSSGANQSFGEKRDDMISLEDKPSVERKVDDDDDEIASKVPEEQFSDGPTPIFEFLDNFNIESEDTSSVLLFGGSALLTLWLASAVVGAIDSIPVLPKLLEIIGLGYTVWFTSRYLIFKKRREELVAKIEELKEEVLGSK
uniref:Cyanobacterial aminoacyl-tRNA synthetase CAAD domain-containing protein n=1 Tax=Cannabis sativa TaxID=3483 RepID=A0A803PDU2_CANSA